MNVRELKREAKEACEWRDHDMKRFREGSFWKNQYFSECRNCGMTVSVRPRPAPNQIEISGQAVAVNCTH